MILFMDGFDHYVNADGLKKWTAANSYNPGITAAEGRRGTAAYRSVITPLFHLYKALTPGDTKFLAAGAFKFTSLAGVSNLFSVQDGGEDRFTTQVVVIQTAAGELAVYRGANTMTLLGTTSGAGITAGVYFHLSAEIVIHPSTGSVKLALNGVTLLNLTGQNTRYTANTQWSGIRVGGESVLGGSLSAASWCDDIVVGDGTGSVNNSLLPDLVVGAHLVNANGNSSMSTPSTGSDRYATVDEATPNTTDYNTLAAAGDKDTLGLQNLSPAGGGIAAVQTLLYAAKTDSGLATLKPVLRQGSNEHDGTEVGLSTSYNYYREMFNVNPIAGGPATPGPWTETDFNALEVGYKRIS